MDLRAQADALPAAYCEPLADDWMDAQGMPGHLRPGLGRAIAGQPVFYAVWSRGRIDVGSWVLFRARIWVLACDDRLVLAALGWPGMGALDRAFARMVDATIARQDRWGVWLRRGQGLLRRFRPLVAAFCGWAADRCLAKRPYLREIPFADVTQAVFNHLTGELLLHTVDNDPVPGLGLDPLAGFQFISQIEQGKALQHA